MILQDGRQYYSVAEATRFIGDRPYNLIRQLVVFGKVPATIINGRRYVESDAIETLRKVSSPPMVVYGPGGKA